VGNEITFKKLESTEIDQVSQFRLVDESDRPLQDFIRRKAHKSSTSNLTQTWIAKRNDDPKVIAYVSIMCAEVALENCYVIEEKPTANNFVFQPAVRIARLAVSRENQKSGLGKQLVDLVIGIVLDIVQPHAGCRFLILDAKRKSIPFYEKLGFRLLETEGNKSAETPLMFMDLQSLL
jgi:GNAT superfamily N-acetyltransferase